MSIDRKAVTRSAIEHRETALCPYYVILDSPSDIAERLDAHYGSDKWRSSYRNYVAGCDRPGSIGLPDTGSGRSLEVDPFGSVWRTDRRPLHLEEPVLKGPTLRGYTFPDVDVFFPDGWEEEVRATIAENDDCFTTISLGFGLFERSWTLRGFAEVLMDVATEPAFFADLIAAIVEHHITKVLDRLLELPLDGIFFSDDWGDQRGVIMGPERWRDVIKPHYARLYGKVKAAGKSALQHCCGSIVDIIPDLIEIGLDVLESVQPEARGMNPYGLKDRFGSQLTFWGGLGSQSTIPFGTPEELRAEIRKLAGYMRKGGGYILSHAKALQPETPTANAAAILEEFMELGEDG